MRRLLLFSFSILFISATACAQDVEVTVDRDELLRDVQILASDALEGRKTGTVGNRMARVYIEDRFQELGLQMVGDSYRHSFDHTGQGTGEEFRDAVNIIGYIEGRRDPDRFIVITAHYDHLGIQNGEIYNGADDNASGTGGLMAIARWFSDYPPENSLILIAFDAEEQGLGGARHFVESPVVPLEQIVLNVNMDMISNNFDNELYAVGTYHYPFLKPMIEEFTADAPVNVLFGYDSDEWEQDWTMASDHGPFHQKGIPFIYFGVEDHPHYHQPTDTFENINPEFYGDAVETIITVLVKLDKRVDEVVEAAEAVD
jgi:Zn-dependent M28 family amino/carboxypeptidase